MRAIVQDRYGSPEDLRLADVPMPEVAEDAVLVRVRAASVNAGDWRRVRGAPVLLRMAEGLRRPKTPLLGGDAAGDVVRVGMKVTDLKPGDAVFGVRTGAFAEYVSGRNFVPKPVNLSFEEAAAVPIAGLTALQAVRDRGAVRPGQRVLINGAGGGVGSFAVQIAKLLGAEVTAVTSTPNLDLVASLGADHLIDYTRDDFTRSGERYDVIVDGGGTPSLAAIRRALTPDGTLVLVAAGKGVTGPLGRIAAASVRSRILRQRIVFFVAGVSKDDLRTLKELVEAGRIRPVIDRTYPLDRVAAAIRYVESERARGKVVLNVAS